MSESLTQYWNRFKPKPGKLNVHPDDLAWFKENQPEALQQKVQKFDGFVRGKRFGIEGDNQFHLSLLPSPFHGNVANAQILILLMNPGFIPSDYFADQDPAFRAACILNLRQSNGKSKFPFFGLNPEFAWSGAFQWAEPRFRLITQRIQKQLTQDSGYCRYYEALAWLSKRIAVLELVPYHSGSGQAISGRVWKDLPSVRIAKEYVEELCLSTDPPLIVVARSHEKWTIPKRARRNVVLCPRTRGITFNPKYDAGKAMLKKLGID